MSESDDRPSLGHSSAAGDLHCPLAGQRIPGHVLAASPDLRQEVLVAVPVEHQAAGLRGRLGVVGQSVDDGGVLAVGADDADGALRGNGEDEVFAAGREWFSAAKAKGTLTVIRRWLGVVWANRVAAVNNRQIVIRVRALFIGVSPFKWPVIPADRSHFAADSVWGQWTASGMAMEFFCTGKLLEMGTMLWRSVPVCRRTRVPKPGTLRWGQAKKELSGVREGRAERSIVRGTMTSDRSPMPIRFAVRTFPVPVPRPLAVRRNLAYGGECRDSYTAEADTTLAQCSTSCATAIDKRRMPSRIISGVAFEKLSRMCEPTSPSAKKGCPGTKATL